MSWLKEKGIRLVTNSKGQLTIRRGAKWRRVIVGWGTGQHSNHATEAVVLNALCNRLSDENSYWIRLVRQKSIDAYWAFFTPEEIKELQDESWRQKLNG